MHEDNIILLFVYFIYWIVLSYLTIKSENKTKTLLTNLIFHLTYSSYFLYGLLYLSKEGSALAWFFYLLLILIAHIILNIVQLVHIYRKQNNHKL